MSFDLIIDGNEAIMGRLASTVAKELLNGKRVAIVNAEKIIISGSKENILERYLAKKRRKNLAKPRKGSFYLVKPDKLFKRTVKGMLPKKTWRGREALKRLKVYIGIPDELKKFNLTKLLEANKTKLSIRSNYLTLDELASLTSDRVI